MRQDDNALAAISQLRAPAFLLGAGGLIPFAGLTYAVLRMPHPHEQWFFTALVAYGAVILSFVGALQWGMLLRDARASRTEGWLSLVWGVVPALVGWVSLLLPADAGLRVLAGAFVLCLMMDMRFALNHSLPPWYLKLRTVLTVVAAGCLAAASFAPTAFVPVGLHI